jgi:hypothetical protein
MTVNWHKMMVVDKGEMFELEKYFGFELDKIH